MSTIVTGAGCAAVTHRDKAPELFIGLIGALGTDLKMVTDILERELEGVGYAVQRIRVSALFDQVDLEISNHKSESAPEDKRIKMLMDSGDRLRKGTRRGHAAMLLAIRDIRIRRRGLAGHSETPKPALATAYVINSLKHPDEVELLRRVYGDVFFAISVYKPRSERIRTIAERIAQSRQSFQPDCYMRCAEDLVNTDAAGHPNPNETDELGQNVRLAFPLADVFVEEGRETKEQVGRFIRLLFRAPFTTPTKDESGMFHAAAAARRSSDLSRQVGAVIATERGEILVSGCNEVPCAGGGAVWEDDEDLKKRDHRDFLLEHDANAKRKIEIVAEVFKKLHDKGWLRCEIPDEDFTAFAEAALDSRRDGVLSKSRLANALEYGRMVHAEMFAITEAARRGASIENATLFCTTFPCHMCARHIIAAGLGRVVYVDPYPKSLAAELYEGIIAVDESLTEDDDRIAFQPFVGVAPRRYLELFTAVTRKDRSTGQAVKNEPIPRSPRVSTYGELTPLYLDRELAYTKLVAELWPQDALNESD